MSSRYLVLWIKTTDMFAIVIRDRISTLLSRLREKIFPHSKLKKTLDIRSSCLCRKLYFSPEDDISEDLLSVDGRVRYAEILNVSSVRSDHVPHDCRGKERSACVLHVKVHCFFLVLLWEVSATLCRKSSVKLTLQKTIIFKYIWFGSKITGQMIVVKDHQDNIFLKKCWSDSIVDIAKHRALSSCVKE